MMKKILTWIILGAMTVALFCGCNKGDTDLDYSRLITPPVDVSITACITDQQLTTVLGQPMQLLGVYEDGTQAIYTSEDGTYQVNINLKNQDRAVFDSDAAGKTTTLQEGLGDTAYWSAETGELVVYANGYALGVWVSCTDTTMVNTYIRQIAEIVVNALQPQQN